MSPGIRSGVNWTRRVCNESAAARARTSKVFATPGTPSSSTCPLHSNATTRPVTAPSWPTTAFATSPRSAVRAARGSADAVGVRRDVGLTPRPPCRWSLGAPNSAVELVELAGQSEQGRVVSRRRAVQDPVDVRRRPATTARDGFDHGRRCGVRGQAEAVTEAFERRAAQGTGGRLACPCGPQQPGPPFDRLGGPYDDRKRLGDDRSDPAAAPQGDEHDDEKQLEGRPEHAVGQQLEQAVPLAVRRRLCRRSRNDPDEAWGGGQQTEAEGRVAFVVE